MAMTSFWLNYWLWSRVVSFLLECFRVFLVRMLPSCLSFLSFVDCQPAVYVEHDGNKTSHAFRAFVSICVCACFRVIIPGEFLFGKGGCDAPQRASLFV